MKGYLSIGTVAKRKGVSIKSLRYYDQIGVLRPAFINKKTNYRYYPEDQLYLLDAISLCIELGIPLRDFEKYGDGHGNFNLQGLLYDGKLLAEQKILDIRKRLSGVQAALQSLDGKSVPVREQSVVISDVTADTSDGNTALDSSETVSDNKEKSSGTVAFSSASDSTDAPDALSSQELSEEPQEEKEEFYQRNIASRAVLTAPFTEDALENYSQRILRLFMLAQLLGMTASYPSGIMYCYDENGSVNKYIFIQVENYADCTDNRLHILPEGTYFCRQGCEHQITDSARLRDIFQLSGKPFLVIESDIIDDSLKQGNNTLELQLFQNL